MDGMGNEPTRISPVHVTGSRFFFFSCHSTMASRTLRWKDPVPGKGQNEVGWIGTKCILEW